MKTAKEILMQKATKYNDGFLSGQIKWIEEAMEEYAIELYTEAKKLNKALVMCRCVVCKKEYADVEPQMCCNGRECGCMGLPIDPPLCSKECGEKLFSSISNGI